MSDPDEISIFDGDVFSPLQDELLGCSSRRVAACCGRRVGKTWSGSRKIIAWMLEDMVGLADEVDAGTRQRWMGESMRPTKAQLVAPDVLYWVVAPREEHLGQIKGNMLGILHGNCRAFVHPKFPDWFTDRGRRLWLWMDGVCGRFDFIPATGQAAMVSHGLHGAWVDEAGFVPNDRYGALAPVLWEHRGRLLATGTPSLGDAHWFTRLAASGLDVGHERYDPAVAEHDPDTTTFIADTIHHAASEVAREEAAKEALFWGEIWAAQWIYADWRLKSANVFREWDEKVHVAELQRNSGATRIGYMPGLSMPPYGLLLGKPIASKPDRTVGVVDWSGGTAPGAAVVAQVWRKSPLSSGDPRPLVVVVEDYEGHNAYTADPTGWWSILGAMGHRWGVDRWMGDPHAPNLIRDARKAGLFIDEGPAQDKLGRLSLLAGLMHHDAAEHVPPAIVVAPRCEHTRRELGGYTWRRTRDGRATNKPKDIDDHCIDCLAMLAGEIHSGAPIIIGGKSFK